MQIERLYKTVFRLSDEELIQKLVKISSIRAIRKGEQLAYSGEIQTQIPFLLNGIFRGYYIDVNGKEITDCFVLECGESVMASFSIDTPAVMNIEAMTDSSVLCLPLVSLKRLLDAYPSLMQIYCELLSASLQRHWNIKSAMYQYSATQRYQWFLETYPGLIDQVPNKYIASFLGMTTVSLSRIRGSIRGGGDKIPGSSVHT